MQKSFAQEVGLDSAYSDFKKANKGFWIVLNVTMFFLAVGMIVGTYEVLNMNPTECSGIRIVLWASIILHTCNILVTLINLSGFETVLCNCNMVCGYFMFQFGIFVFMQFTYFESQMYGCM